MKKSLILILLICIIFISGCNKESNLSGDNKENITFTNKFECKRGEVLKKVSFKMLSKIDPEKDYDNVDAVNVVYLKTYDYDEKGEKLLAYYDTTSYEFLIDYDMDEVKKYFENSFTKKDSYKSFNITLNENVINIIYSLDLNSSEAKDYLTKTTLKDLKENYKESPYTCN